MLRTKAMREREEQKEKRKYRYSLIRIRFPDGLVLQGTFSVYEKFSAVLEFVTDSLECPLPFVLFDAGRGLIDSDKSEYTTLLDLGLIPSAILTFNWRPDVAGGVGSQLSNLDISDNEKPAYLKHDLLKCALEERP
jgi:UBX domain-containing protein 6